MMDSEMMGQGFKTVRFIWCDCCTTTIFVSFSLFLCLLLPQTRWLCQNLHHL